MGILLACLNSLAMTVDKCHKMTVDKYTIAHKFYSWHHHCCGNFSWLEGFNILFLSQLSLPPSQAAYRSPRMPSGYLGKREPFCVSGLAGKFLGTQEEEI